MFANMLNTRSASNCGKRSRDELSDREESVHEDSLAPSISDVLSFLHKTMPSLNYPQYEGALRQQGIAYANAVDGFDRDFFVDIGMAKGAVKEFIRVAKKIAKGKGNKRARVDDGQNEKEN
jgi:hypothetical protein